MMTKIDEFVVVDPDMHTPANRKKNVSKKPNGTKRTSAKKTKRRHKNREI
jgi:hypothetical protein